MGILLKNDLYAITIIDQNKLRLIGHELNCNIVNDLLEFFPIKYISQTKIDDLSSLNDNYLNNIIIITGYVKNLLIVTNKNKKHLEGYFIDQYNNKIKLIWFNHLEHNKRRFSVDERLTLSGEVTKFKHDYYLVHPQIIKAIPMENSLIAYYKSTERLKRYGLDSSFFRKLFNILLQDVDIEENIPDDIVNRYKLMPRYEALREIHIPSDNNKLALSRRRLKFEELFFFQLKVLQTKLITQQKNKGFVCCKTILSQFFISRVINDISLTVSQKKVLEEIRNDLSSGQRMNRLIQGDVGCGKTIIAFITILCVVDSGSQAVLLCPTEILAEQHFIRLKQWCEQLNISISLLTSSTSTKERNIILKQLQTGQINIIIGTHAILNDSIVFKQLGLVVIDEQHKFGVRQRSQLLENNKLSIRPHILLMTATPIPRTLALTLYGGYDVSIVDEKPVGRKEIKTIHLSYLQQLRALGLIKQQIQEGYQVYIVFPVIEQSDKLKLKNINDGYTYIADYFKGNTVGILHGQMDIKTREEEMSKFAEGKTKILVATTVIEVGIDVPKATMIVIVDADHYGLAQLHQLRGRVGRGAAASLCVLLTKDNLSDIAQMRMKAMIEYNDGFKIADIDMRLRGYGDMMGTTQSGNKKLKIADLYNDERMLYYAHLEAKKILDEDPTLEKHTALQQQMLIKNDINFGNVG